MISSPDKTKMRVSQNFNTSRKSGCTKPGPSSVHPRQKPRCSGQRWASGPSLPPRSVHFSFTLVEPRLGPLSSASSRAVGWNVSVRTTSFRSGRVPRCASPTNSSAWIQTVFPPPALLSCGLSLRRLVSDSLSAAPFNSIGTTREAYFGRGSVSPPRGRLRSPLHELMKGCGAALFPTSTRKTQAITHTHRCVQGTPAGEDQRQAGDHLELVLAVANWPVEGGKKAQKPLLPVPIFVRTRGSFIEEPPLLPMWFVLYNMSSDTI